MHVTVSTLSFVMFYIHQSIDIDVNLRVQAACMVKLEKIVRHIVRPEDSAQAQTESTRGHNQTGSDVWERMVCDEGEQQDEYCYH